jgi:ATP-dependent exoDNAse (exonuclease V) beta subunit
MKNIELINASAGSGKTYSLTNRVVDILKDGIAPESLMATTFTNKASAELRERIRIQLLQANFNDEAGRIRDGFIGTVNSICGRLLKEYSLEAGMSPAIEIMPEEDSRSIFNISIKSVIEQYGDRMEPAAKRLGLDGGGSGYAKRDDWRDFVKKVVDLARSNQISNDNLRECSRDSWESLKNIFGDPLDEELDKELYDAMTVALSHLKQIEKMTKTTEKAVAELKKCYDNAGKNRLTWSDWVKLSKLKTAKDGEIEVGPVKVIADNVLNHPGFQDDVRQIIEGTFDCAIGALEDYESYKQEHGLMDFTDQETHILDMARNNEPFKASISDRIDMLMVDEFQDTSPIQLALFLALNELAGKSVWVGDPKQAIYGFRGTDPQLMDEVVSWIGESQILDCSWRSREKLIEFTNALFSQVFHEMGSEKVALKVPEARAEKAKGGQLEVWHLLSKNNEQDNISIANGVKDLLERNPDIKPGYIAVLCRTNTNCAQVAAYLGKLGIRASVGQGLLMETEECCLAMAALRYMNNKNDTLALTEIMKTLVKKESDEDWFSELVSKPRETMEKWNEDKVIVQLNEGRDNIRYWTPLEALEQAISRIDLLRIVKSWSNPKLAGSNLDTLRGACGDYIAQCSSHGSGATIDGFIRYMSDSETGQAQGIGDETVNVLTYHSAKGLEWPWVVLAELDKGIRSGVFGVNIEVAEEFDPTEPLANRRIRFWPWPFGSSKKYEMLDAEIDLLPVSQQTYEKAECEAQRLMYVGMTRAKDGLVMAMRKASNRSGESLKTGWLDSLKDAEGNEVIQWSMEAGEQEISVGKEEIKVIVYEYISDIEDVEESMSVKEEFLPVLTESKVEYSAARIAPSSLHDDGSEGGIWETVERFASRIHIKGKPKMDMLGNAVHGYLAVDRDDMADDARLKMAGRILKNWEVEASIEASEVVTAGKNLTGFLNEHYPEHKIFTEWPMMMRNKENQVIQGWIDMMLETKDGYVIIDHKDYPGKDIEERMKMYTSQLKAYKEAVEKATGKPVVDVLIHLPVSGMMLRLE